MPSEDLQALLDLVPVAVWFAHDAECRTITGNAHADRILHAPRGGNISRSAPCEETVVQYRTFSGGVEVAPDELPSQVACRTGQPVHDQELELRFEDGSAISMVLNAVPLFDADGRIRGSVTAGSDITSLKEVDRAFRELSLRLASHIENSPLAVIQWGPDLRITQWSGAAERIFGWKAEEVLHLRLEGGRLVRDGERAHWQADEVGGLQWEDLPWVHDEDAAQVSALSGVLCDGTARRNFSANRNYRKDGAIVDCEWYNSTLVDESGKTCSILSLVLDVTARRRAEDALRLREALSNALNEIGELLHSTLHQEEIMRRAMASAAQALQCDSAAISLRAGDQWVVRYVHGLPQDVVGNVVTPDELNHAILAVETRAPVSVSDASHDPRVNRAHMEKWGVLAVLVVPLVLRDVAMGVIFFNYQAPHELQEAHVDFGRRLARHLTLALENSHLVEELERELAGRRASEERLREYAQSLQAVNQELESFSYTISHDLRAPLRALDGFSAMVAERAGEMEGQLDPEIQGYLRRIRSSAVRMGKMVDDLLLFSRTGRHALKLEPVSIEALVRELWPDCLYLEGRCSVELTMQQLPGTIGDIDLLRQVVANLLSNAIKFTRGRTPAVVEVGAREQSGETVYFVRDTGVGFDMRYVGKLFHVFQRLHHVDDFEGTGAGLAIARRIVERHGGRVWAEGELERGATFYFSLPHKMDAPTG